MKLLAISEHYFPCPAGTVSYVHHTLTALVGRGVEVELWVPGPEPTVWLPEGMAVPSYKVVWIDVGHTATSVKSKEETAVEIENAKHVLLDMLDVQIRRFKYRKGFSKKRFYSNAPAASNIWTTES